MSAMLRPQKKSMLHVDVRRWMVLMPALAVALGSVPALASTGDKLDRSRFVPTFLEDFYGKLNIYDAKTNPKGRWKTNYDFGWQEGASSRTLNGEQEVYVTAQYDGIDPFQVKSGILTITAARNPRPDDPKLAGKPYTSGLLTTSPSFSQLYGFFEIRARLPTIPGAWPAFWLVTPLNPAIEAPQYGDEIDVVELLGQDPSVVYCSLHWPNLNGGSLSRTIAVKIAGTDRQRTYGVLWTPDSIAWYVDDVEVQRQANPGMRRPMNILIDLAIGGWNGNAPPESLPTMQMQVEYIRAYELR